MGLFMEVFPLERRTPSPKRSRALKVSTSERIAVIADALGAEVAPARWVSCQRGGEDGRNFCQLARPATQRQHNESFSPSGFGAWNCPGRFQATQEPPHGHLLYLGGTNICITSVHDNPLPRRPLWPGGSRDIWLDPRESERERERERKPA